MTFSAAAGKCTNCIQDFLNWTFGRTRPQHQRDRSLPPSRHNSSMSHPAPYTVQLDPNSARNLATHGASILLLDVPLGTPVGMDQQVFLTGPRFKGIKMIPPGVHFLSYQALGKDGSLGPPVSTLVNLTSQQVLVRRWDQATEGLVPLADEDEEARYAAGVARFDFDRELAPYDLNSYSQWVSLSCYITQQLLEELLPAGGEVSIMCETSLLPATTAAEKQLQQQLEEGRARMQSIMQIDRPDETHQPQQQEQQQQEQQAQLPAENSSSSVIPIRGSRCRYTSLPRLLKVPGTTAAQLTALNMDKTSLLEQAMQRYSNSSSTSSSSQQQQLEPQGVQLIGELQFAFIVFMFGQSLEGYMQWKQLMVLFLGCIAGPLQKYPQLFVAFLSAVTAQLQFGVGNGSSHKTTAEDRSQPSAFSSSDGDVALLGGGLVDELLPDSFLKGAFRGFFEVLQESGDQASPALSAQARVLESVLAARLGWDFRLKQMRLGSDVEDDDDDGPVVVELSEQQLAQLDLTS